MRWDEHAVNGRGEHAPEWVDDDPEEETGVDRSDGRCAFCGEVDCPAQHFPEIGVPSLGLDFFWRQVGTDIEVRVRPDFLASGPPWQHQYAPTGLLTIHLAGDPADAEPVREVPDPLEPIETPGPTFVRQAEWDDATQTWRTPDAGPHETYVTGPVGGHWIWKCRQCSASAGHGFRSVAEAEAEEHRKENAR